MMKLRLRPCKREDGREVMKWFSDERQMRMWCRDGFTFPLTDGQMDNYYAELERDPRAWGFTALDKDGKPVIDDKSGGIEYFTIGKAAGELTPQSDLPEASTNKLAF